MKLRTQARILLVGIILSLVAVTASAQWLKTSGKKIIDQSGNEVILRGMGLGGWMLQEPYMMEMSDFASAQWQIKAKIQDLIGPANTAAFYDAWHANHCTKRDIDSMASWGFNSVRLPMHYNLFTLPIEEEPVAGSNTWLDEGFALTDSLIKWCSAQHMYVILDLHAAPGGQGKDYAICDGNPAKLSLWESDANKQKTIALWRKLAERYANEPWVGGYDMLNEPNWSFTAGGNQNGCSETSNAPLRQLLINITNAIREADTKHIIIIEGNCWGNNYSGILPAWDNNTVVSFHKYWSYNDPGSIQGMVNLRNQYNIPLWLGESGENSNPWFTSAIRLAETNNIGWAWWPLKKISSVVGPLTIKKTAEYQTLLDYWTNGGSAPSAGFATYTLIQMATNAKNEYCVYHKDVIDAMFRQVNDSTTRAFAHHAIPGIIPATGYDLGRNGKAYSDTDTANYQVSSGTYTAWNKGWSYRNDGVDIETTADASAGSNGYDVGWTANGEWLQYTANVDSTAAYTVQFHYASLPGPEIKLSANDAGITPTLTVPSSGGMQTWKDLAVNDVILYKGSQKLKLVFEKGGINLGFIRFSISGKTSDIPLKSVSAETYQQTELIYLSFNKILVDSTVKADGFSCTLNGNPANISSLTKNARNSSQVIISLDQQITAIDTLEISCIGGKLRSADGTALEDFSKLRVKNNLPAYLTIPGKIEAEAFSFNQGLQLENTTDVGGGQDVGYTNTGDYLDYRVRVLKTGKYTFELRIACLQDAGLIQVQQLDDSSVVLNSCNINVPVTGGWQTWRTVNSELSLTEGLCKLRVKILQPEFNMNWYRFTDKSQGIELNTAADFSIYPNPARNILTVEIARSKGQRKSLSFRNLNGVLMKKTELSMTDDSQTIDLGDIPKGFYFLELDVSGTIYRSKLIIQ
ncbi:MAG: carbohydrate-binding protein [Bacteroidales bacterium]